MSVTIPQAVGAVATLQNVWQNTFKSKLQYRKRYELLQHDMEKVNNSEFKLQYRKRYELLQLQYVYIPCLPHIDVTIPQAVGAVATKANRKLKHEIKLLQYRKRYELLQLH